jgi:hypothetical protein
VAGNPHGYGRDARGEERDHRQPVQRFRPGWRVGKSADSVRGDDAVMDDEVVARRTPQARCVPGVEDDSVTHRQEHEP